jgi:hypothetical protein
MPILKRARRVIVLTVEGGAAVPGPKGEQVCRYLQFNDVPARPLTVSLDGRLTGEAILAHDERNDDLKSVFKLACWLTINESHGTSMLLIEKHIP